MQEIIKKKYCTGCSACYNICPKNAITMKKDKNGFSYPWIDNKKCINCGLCKRTCPVLNNEEMVNYTKVYACYNKDEQERLNSSSGGIFILLAKQIIKAGGSVVGAGFTEDYKVAHMIANSTGELENLMTSKYVQSDINGILKATKGLLDSNKTILFCGTPCQIEGLRQFLKKDYKNLYTIDIICHGVPSPKVWDKYVKFRQKKDKDKLNKINFRDKTKGWHKFQMKFQYKNKTYEKSLSEDIYLKLFLNNIILRESCYNCFAKKRNRTSDITLADYWGIEKVFPEMDDQKGTSVTIVNSKKGEHLFNEIKNQTVFKQSNLDTVIKYNEAMIKSAIEPTNRKYFFNDLDNMEIDKLAKKYLPKEKQISKIKNIIKKLIKKI